MDDWPFADPENVATITVRQIVSDGAPILLVVHDVDDGCWQFLTGETMEHFYADALVLGLGEMLDLDPTLRDLADLPLGWQATRDRVGAPWRREPHEAT